MDAKERAAFERGVRAGLEAGAKVAAKMQAAASKRADDKSITKLARYGWQERAVACFKIAALIRAIDPAIIKGDTDNDPA